MYTSCFFDVMVRLVKVFGLIYEETYKADGIFNRSLEILTHHKHLYDIG